VLSPQAGLPIYGIWATDTNNIYASSVGTILHYNGSSWSSVYAGATDTFLSIAGISNSEIFATGSNGDVAVYNGSSWALEALTTSSLNSIYAVSPTTLYGGGNGGMLGYYNGSTYGEGYAAGSGNITGVWGDAYTDVYAVGADGSIQYTTNGTSFSYAINPQTGVSFTAVHGLTGVDLWVAAASGYVVHHPYNTGTWTAMATTTTSPLRAIWDAASGDVYAVGDGGVITHWNGSEWLTMPSGVTSPLRALHGTSQTHILVGGDNGVVLMGTR